MIQIRLGSMLVWHKQCQPIQSQEDCRTRVVETGMDLPIPFSAFEYSCLSPIASPLLSNTFGSLADALGAETRVPNGKQGGRRLVSIPTVSTT